MVEVRHLHGFVATNTKLFAIGGNHNDVEENCEVYDVTSSRFALVSNPPESFGIFMLCFLSAF